MAEGDGAAVHVDLIGIPAQFLTHRQRLHGEGFVGFDQVQLGQRPAGLFQAAAGGGDRADAHDRRVDAGVGVAGDLGQHRQAQGLGLAGAHQHHCGGAVVEGRGVAGGDAAVLLEGCTQAAEGFGRGAGARLLVTGEGDRVALALGNHDRGDLGIEAAAFDGRRGTLLRLCGEGVLLGAVDAVLVGQVLRGDAHVVVVEGVPQAVGDHGIDDLRVAHAQAGACAGQNVGRQAHVLHAAGDDHFGIAAADRLHGQMHGLEARAAYLVQRHGRYGVGQAGLDRGLARGVLPGAGGEHMAEDDFIDLGRVDTGLFQQGADHGGAQFDCRHIGQRALETADGGAGCSYDDDVLHDGLRIKKRYAGA